MSSVIWINIPLVNVNKQSAYNGIDYCYLSLCLTLFKIVISIQNILLQKSIQDKYNVPGSQLRIYIHYQPSFYHLHVHFNYLQHEAPGIYAEKAHPLDTVINNIEMMGDYYKKANLPFTIRELDNMFNVYETNGYLQRVEPNIENSELIDK